MTRLADTITTIHPLDRVAQAAAAERQSRLTKPPGSLGVLEDLSVQLAGLAGTCPPPIPEPAVVAIFAADHGVHAQGVTPWPQEVTAQMVANFVTGGAVVNAFARQMGATVSDPTFFDADLARAFKLFPILEKRRDQRGGTLSGGEQQMLAIARALMARPRLLLLDEPSLGLAPLLVKQIFAAIKDLNEKEGMTVFLVEQNAFHALKLAHRAYVMVNGSIAISGTGKELLASPEIRAAYLEGSH